MQAKSTGIRGSQIGESERQRTTIAILRQNIIRHAVRRRRASLLVSPAPWKGLLARRVLTKPYELGSIGSRFSFLRDEQMLLAELRIRTAAAPPVREMLSKPSEIGAEARPPSKEGRKCQ
jgi:hypothetical protein